MCGSCEIHLLVCPVIILLVQCLSGMPLLLVQLWYWVPSAVLGLCVLCLACLYYLFLVGLLTGITLTPGTLVPLWY
jgi:uncharacterized membrane protein